MIWQTFSRWKILRNFCHTRNKTFGWEISLRIFVLLKWNIQGQEILQYWTSSFKFKFKNFRTYASFGGIFSSVYHNKIYGYCYPTKF
jgi:hypothetical protein